MKHKLSGKQKNPLRIAAIAHLLKCTKISDAAERIGIDPDTLRAWFDEPEFKAAYEAARNRIIQKAVDKCVDGASESVDFLRAVVGKGADNPEPRKELTPAVKAAAVLVDTSGMRHAPGQPVEAIKIILETEITRDPGDPEPGAGGSGADA